MRGLVSYTDFLTICTARNERQARAIVDEVRVRVKQEQGLLPGGVGGGGGAGWIVLDYLDCVLHVFTAGGARALPARGPLARGAAPRARLRRARGAFRRRRRMAIHEMPSEGSPTVPRMGSFKRALFGYRRPEVDAAIAARDARRSRALRARRAEQAPAARAQGRIQARRRRAGGCASLSGMVIERERRSAA